MHGNIEVGDSGVVSVIQKKQNVCLLLGNKYAILECVFVSAFVLLVWSINTR